MKSNKKIDILSPEEMRQETIESVNQSSRSDCTISRECANGKKLECSGASCKDEYEMVGGKKVLKYIECLDENGFLINYQACDNSDSGSGSSGTASSAKDACKNLAYGSGCEWRDETGLMHYGSCQYDYDSPKLTLICK